MKLVIVTDTHGDDLLTDRIVCETIAYHTRNESVPLIHLGDWVHGRIENPRKMFSQLILVRGNHDPVPEGHTYPPFDIVVNCISFGPVFFSHEPVLAVPRYTYRNLHGHLHNEDFSEPVDSDIYTRYGYARLNINQRIPAKTFYILTISKDGNLSLTEAGYG